ncbi:cytochrome b/b6 domain-containing protein [Ferrimonas balearica]|uniref:cytochrome b/b6 domain-containing protein n=1 Tax=Ferrimonas balearica TaxID=44012 RepID=UPI001C9906A7|nr:cytochrome b/b6 domain-containing protein [Ferrimonas balearica]MBY5993461.1 cytochrome b/b6 domain-containing protein [Ferrimonas balearica]
MKIQVWDKVVRVCHWGMVILLPLCWWSGEQGEMEWHQSFAYLLLALLMTRLFWGLFGSETARFSQFVRGPRQVFDYLKSWKQQRDPHPGHNPAGAYMVVVMLTLLLTQLVSGLFATDDILTEGPLYSYVSSDTASWLTWLHKQNFNLILAAVGLHLTALLVYRLKGTPLVAAMITGYRRGGAEAPKMVTTTPAWLVLLVLMAGLGWGLIWPLW